MNFYPDPDEEEIDPSQGQTGTEIDNEPGDGPDEEPPED